MKVKIYSIKFNNWKLIWMQNIILLLLLSLFPLFGYNQEKGKNHFNSDTIFMDISTDSLHISLSTFGELKDAKTVNKIVQWRGAIISDNFRQEMNLESNVGYALGKIIMDTDKKVIGFIVGCDDLKVRLYVYSLESKKFIFNVELASYEYLKTAYEKIRNSWIRDINGDGSLDIAIWENLRDFEPPNELSDNISGDEKFIYYYTDNNFEYKDWTIHDLTNVTLTK